MGNKKTSAPLIGILAGGQGSRMGGVDKAALQAPDQAQPLLWRTVDLTQGLGLPCALVGARASFKRQRPHLTYLSDDPAGVGPLGGLSALLKFARSQPCILLACDMPYLEPSLILKLARAKSAASIVAARDSQSAKWQPFFARYDSATVAPVLINYIQAGGRSFQGLFRNFAAEALPLNAQEEKLLADWDKPEDLRQPAPGSPVRDR